MKSKKSVVIVLAVALLMSVFSGPAIASDENIQDEQETNLGVAQELEEDVVTDDVAEPEIVEEGQENIQTQETEKVSSSTPRNLTTKSPSTFSAARKMVEPKLPSQDGVPAGEIYAYDIYVKYAGTRVPTIILDIDPEKGEYLGYVIESYKDALGNDKTTDGLQVMKSGSTISFVLPDLQGNETVNITVYYKAKGVEGDAINGTYGLWQYLSDRTVFEQMLRDVTGAEPGTWESVLGEYQGAKPSNLEIYPQSISTFWFGQSGAVRSVMTLGGIQKEETPGKLAIEKIDGKDKSKLKGAKFDIVNSEGTVVYKNLVTDEEGQLKIGNMPSGDYKLIEKEAPKGYVLDASPISFSIKADEETELVVENLKEEANRKEISIAEKKSSDKNVMSKTSVAKSVKTGDASSKISYLMGIALIVSLLMGVVALKKRAERK